MERPRVLVAPSLMCADATRLADEVRQLEACGVDWLHFDVMDGRFVPNLPLGFGVLAALRPHTALPFDVHLMVERNDWFIERVAELGASCVSVHAESAVHLDRSLALVKSFGLRAGAALNPATPVGVLEHVLDRLDFVLVMTVNPGFAGQTLVPSALRKIREMRSFLDRHGRRILLEVDGNVSFERIPEMVAAGADVLVAGTSSLYRDGSSLEENMERLRECVARGLAARAGPPERRSVPPREEPAP